MNEPMDVAFAPDRLAVLLKHFAELNDERESWRVEYPLKEVLLLVTCATIATWIDSSLFARCFESFVAAMWPIAGEGRVSARLGRQVRRGRRSRLRTFGITEIARYYALGDLPQPHATHRFY
jgi:hypothetical protein